MGQQQQLQHERQRRTLLLFLTEIPTDMPTDIPKDSRKHELGFCFGFFRFGRGFVGVIVGIISRRLVGIVRVLRTLSIIIVVIGIAIVNEILRGTDISGIGCDHELSD